MKKLLEVKSIVTKKGGIYDEKMVQVCRNKSD